MKSNWSRLKISELCDLIVDCVNKTAPRVELETPYKMIRTPNIKNGRIDLTGCRFVEKDTYEKWTRRAKVIRGDVLLTREAPMGEVGLVTFDDTVFLGQRIMQYRANPRKLDSNFLLYAFLSPDLQFQFGRYNNGGSIVSHIRVPDCFEFEIITPPLNLQKKIAGVLGSLDSKISLNNRINAELEAMAKTTYDYWFVQFDFPISKEQAKAMGTPKFEGKPYKASGGKMIWSEKLKREVPEFWNIGRASDMIEFNPTLSLERNKLSSYIDMDALPQKGFMTKAIQEKAFAGGMKFQNGDVAMARITPCLENGKTGLITLLKEGEIGFGSTEFIIMRGKRLDLRCYLSSLSRSEKFRSFAISKMTGTSGRKRVSALDLENFLMALPDEETLIRFEEMVTPFFSKMTSNTIENQKLSELRDWLLPMLMNGQVRIKETEEKIERVVKQKPFRPANVYFYQTQVVAAIINASKHHNIKHGEMTLAKYSYLVDKIYKVPTFFQYDRWHLGPYPKEMKKVVKNKKFFEIQNGEVSVVNEEKLAEYNNHYQKEIENAVKDLAAIFSKYKGKERSYQTELLATVCKVVEDIQSTNVKAVRESMENWPIKLEGEKYKNKAEKFGEEETKDKLDYIITRTWDQQLI